MVNTSNYCLVQQGGFTFLFVMSKETDPCPICGEGLSMRGWRLRAIINGAGNKTSYYIRRLRCHKCNRLHHELPDFIVPYKRHCAQTIEAVITGEIKASEGRLVRRVRRWWCAVLPYFMGVIEALRHKHEIRGSAPPAFKEIVRAAVNSNNWVFEKPVCTRSAWVS